MWRLQRIWFFGDGKHAICQVGAQKLLKATLRIAACQIVFVGEW